MVFINRWSGGFQIFWGFVLFLIFIFTNFFFYDTSFAFNELSYLGIAIITFLIAVISIGSLKIISPKIRPNHTSIIWWVLASLSVILTMLIGQVPQSITAVLESKALVMNTVAILATAIFEESLCRGLLLSGFLDHQVSYDRSYKLTRAAIYSSIIFGCLHITNLIGVRVDSQTIFQQVFYASAMGLFFAALRITTNGLSLPILLHFVLDWAPIDGASNMHAHSWWLVLGLYLPLLVLSIGYLINLDRQITELNYKK